MTFILTIPTFVLGNFLLFFSVNITSKPIFDPMSRFYLLRVLLCVFHANTQTQICPIKPKTRLFLLYGVYLSDHISPNQKNLRLVSLLNNLTQPGLNICMDIEPHYKERLLMCACEAYNLVSAMLFSEQPRLIQVTRNYLNQFGP